MTVENFLPGIKGPVYLTVNIMVTDGLAMQGWLLIPYILGKDIRYQQPEYWSTVNSLIKDAPNPKHKCFWSHLAVAFAHYIEARWQVDNEDVVGAEPTGDAPTTSTTTSKLPTKVRLILENLQYFAQNILVLAPKGLISSDQSTTVVMRWGAQECNEMTSCHGH